MVVARMVVAAIGGHDEKSPRCLEGAGGGGIGWVGEQLEAVLAVDVSQLMKCPLMTVSTRPSVLGTSAHRRSAAAWIIVGDLTEQTTQSWH